MGSELFSQVGRGRSPALFFMRPKRSLALTLHSDKTIQTVVLHPGCNVLLLAHRYAVGFYGGSLYCSADTAVSARCIATRPLILWRLQCISMTLCVRPADSSQELTWNTLPNSSRLLITSLVFQCKCRSCRHCNICNTVIHRCSK